MHTKLYSHLVQPIDADESIHSIADSPRVNVNTPRAMGNSMRNGLLSHVNVEKAPVLIASASRQVSQQDGQLVEASSEINIPLSSQSQQVPITSAVAASEAEAEAEVNVNVSLNDREEYPSVAALEKMTLEEVKHWAAVDIDLHDQSSVLANLNEANSAFKDLFADKVMSPGERGKAVAKMIFDSWRCTLMSQQPNAIEVWTKKKLNELASSMKDWPTHEQALFRNGLRKGLEYMEPLEKNKILLSPSERVAYKVGSDEDAAKVVAGRDDERNLTHCSWHHALKKIVHVQMLKEDRRIEAAMPRAADFFFTKKNVGEILTEIEKLDMFEPADRIEMLDGMTNQALTTILLDPGRAVCFLSLVRKIRCDDKQIERILDPDMNGRHREFDNIHPVLRALEGIKDKQHLDTLTELVRIYNGAFNKTYGFKTRRSEKQNRVLDALLAPRKNDEEAIKKAVEENLVWCGRSSYVTDEWLESIRPGPDNTLLNLDYHRDTNAVTHFLMTGDTEGLAVTAKLLKYMPSPGAFALIPSSEARAVFTRTDDSGAAALTAYCNMVLEKLPDMRGSFSLKMLGEALTDMARRKVLNMSIPFTENPDLKNFEEKGKVNKVYAEAAESFKKLRRAVEIRRRVTRRREKDQWEG